MLTQVVVGGGLTLDVTEKFATETMNLLSQPVCGDAQNHDDALAVHRQTSRQGGVAGLRRLYGG